MIDWQSLLNAPVMGVFGEAASFQPRAGAAHDIHGTFHEAFKSIDLLGGSDVTSVMPELGVVLSEFQVPPQQGDLIVITPTALHGGGTYVVKEVRPNGIGVAVLLLNWLED